jgi:thioredoxin 2
MPTLNTRTVTVPCAFCGTLARVNLDRIDDRPRCSVVACGKPMLLDRPIALHDADFARVIADSQVPVLVDFYADWCGPCKAMAPVLDQIASEYKALVLVAKVDTDRQQQVASSYSIRSIPTLMVFTGGSPVVQQLGAVPRTRLIEMLSQAGVPLPR